MKKLYVTYLQSGILKKAEITEARYTQLNTDPTVSDLTVYSSNLLQEQNFQAKSQSGQIKNKHFLHG